MENGDLTLRECFVFAYVMFATWGIRCGMENGDLTLREFFVFAYVMFATWGTRCGTENGDLTPSEFLFRGCSRHCHQGWLDY